MVKVQTDEIERLIDEIRRKDMEYTELNGENHSLRVSLTATLRTLDIACHAVEELEQEGYATLGWCLLCEEGSLERPNHTEACLIQILKTRLAQRGDLLT